MYTIFDIPKMLKNMYIVCDTREQDTPKLRRRLAEMPCKVERGALAYGDYRAYTTTPDGEVICSPVVIERKMNIGEICNNFCKGRERFIKEFSKAKTDGARMAIVVEDATWEDIRNGKYNSLMRPEALTSSIFAFACRYNASVYFCKPQTSGWFIYNLLYRSLKEELEEKAENVEEKES